MSDSSYHAFGDDDIGDDAYASSTGLSDSLTDDKLSVDSDIVVAPTPFKAARKFKALSSHFANFSIQYNFNSITLALTFATKFGPDGTQFYAVTSSQSGLLKSLVFVGAVLGQLTMGYLGDCWGRLNAMIFTNCLVVFGALASALLTIGDENVFITVCYICRLIIGIGIGGNYPLAATMSSEAAAGSGDGSKAKSGFKVAGSFFWQLPGLLSVYVFGLILAVILGEEGTGKTVGTAVSFRLLLGCGAIPSLVVVILLSMLKAEEKRIAAMQQNMEEELSSPVKSKAGVNIFKVVASNPAFLSYLVATGGCWFMYDFVYYGSLLNTPTILDGVFGQNNSLVSTCWQTLAADSASFPGVIAGIYSLKCITAKQLQSWGFLSMTIAFIIMGSLFFPMVNIEQTAAGRWGAFAFLCVLSMTLNYGAGLSTYVLPTQTYPPHIRSTFFGVSAALGKLGAVVGTAVFEPIFNCCALNPTESNSTVSLGATNATTVAPSSDITYGPTLTFGIACLVCVIAIILTHFFVDPRRDSSFCDSVQQNLKPRGLGSVN